MTIETGPAEPTLAGTDPDAPYGRKEDGTPYKMSPERRAELGRQMAEGRRRAASTGGTKRRTKSAAGRGSKAARPAGPDYRTMAAGLMQLPAFALSLAARLTGSPALALDAVAITVHTPPLAEAIESICLDDARWAAVMERVATVGPYGALVTAMIPLVAQIATNHGIVPPQPELGTYDPDGLMRAAGIDVPDGPGGTDTDTP